jgi:glycosidase
MQWSADAAGGFTSDTHSELAVAAQRDSERGYLRVNVRAQQDEPGSLFSLAKSLALLRAKYPQIGKRGWDRLDLPDASLLALCYGEILVIHNFSARPQRVSQIPDGRCLLGSEIEDGVLPAYGFVWLLTAPER